MQSVDDFIESLLNEKGITDVSPEVKDRIKEEMKTELLRQIDRAAIMRLDEEKAAELANLVDDPNFTKEQMSDFVQNAGVNLTEVTADTMLKFRSLYLGTEG